MVDKSVIEELIKNLDFKLGQLRNKVNISLEEYIQNYDLQAIIERRLEESIQTCIDIGNNIISQNDLRIPSTYKEIFQILMENRIISKNVSERMMDLAGFRNILVHEYLYLDQNKVFLKFKESLNVFSTFISEIKNFLKCK